MVVKLYQKKEVTKYKQSIPNRKQILFLIKKNNNLISKNFLEKKFYIKCKEDKKIFRERLKRMECENQIIYTCYNRYILPGNLNIVKGKVIGHRNGYGFLRTETLKEDLWLSKDQMKLCMHGDIILAYVEIRDKKHRNVAKILKILQKNNALIVGRYFLNKKIAFVVPNDDRFNFKIIISSEKILSNISIGSIVVVKLKKNCFKNQIRGKIVELLGEEIDTKVSINIAIRTHCIPNIWPKEIQKQLHKISKKITQKDLHNRIDLRHLPFFTIDEEDAKDFDDAIFCEKKENQEGWNLWVAISDVSYYVQPNSALDKEALKRGNSVYFPSLVIPMLPEKISFDLCSLNPFVERLCLICEMSLSNEGKLIKYKHYEAIIRSHGRFTYNQIFNIWNGDLQLRLKYKNFLKHIQNMFFLFNILKKFNISKKSICFKKMEAQFILNSNLCINKIYPKVSNDAHKFIEFCMILANIASAKFVKNYNCPVLFRNHNRPSKESVTTFRLILKGLGLSLSGGENPDPEHYSKLLTSILNRPDYEMIQTLLLRSMKQAVYSPENKGHFGLSLSSYIHFTSPIRRYPDLILHRVIKKLLFNKKEKNFQKNDMDISLLKDEIKKIGIHCSITERRADDATRDVIDWLKCEFMQKKIGQVLTGVISNVTSFGFFVRLNQFFIDGLVHVATLHDDYYYFDSIGLKLIGKSTKNVYRLGDSLNVKVISVNLIQKKIELSI